MTSLWRRFTLVGDDLAALWFTPTPVGTMQNMGNCCLYRTVHPHACGDDQQPEVLQAIRRGSPPRLWGRWLMCFGGNVARRFTPTPVGTM